MVRKVLYPAVFVLAMLIVAPAFGNWLFWYCENSRLDTYGIDALFYENDQTTLVEEGSLVQFVIALGSAPIVDPLEYFDTDHSGQLEWGTPEYANMVAWVNAGADPAAISGGTNVLMTAANWGGETALSMPGYFVVDPVLETGNPYSIVPGNTFGLMAYRVWDLSKEEMETFCTRPMEELWYLTGRELTSHNNQGGGPDTGWWLCMPGNEGGGACAPADWAGFNGLVGFEILNNLRTQYTLNTLLGICIPEPGTILLIGGSVLLLLLRRKK